ncbi:conjugal transfer pilus assembly protein TraU [Escherichia coli]|nr:conjugal transfer pilus assembly protein TraU [Escherichia coli]
MKRCMWLCVVWLLTGHVPAASADAACEGRFVNPITDICWSCIFPLSLGSTKVSQGKVPDTANPSMPLQFCPAPPPVFKRIGLAIGYWEPMALTDVTRSPGCMVNLGFSRHCCKVSDEAAFCLIQRPYISKTLLTRRISPRGSP